MNWIWMHTVDMNVLGLNVTILMQLRKLLTHCFLFNYYSTDSVLYWMYVQNIFLTHGQRVKKTMACQNIASEATWPGCSGPKPSPRRAVLRPASLSQHFPEHVYVTRKLRALPKDKHRPKPRGALRKHLQHSQSQLRWKARRCGSSGSSHLHGDHPHPPLPNPFALAWLEAIKNMCVTCFVWQWR